MVIGAPDRPLEPRAGRFRVTARRLGAWARTPDGRSVLVLVVVPILLFGVPALAGYPPLSGDNLIQNFPLRVLTGQQLAAGHLPLWNPYAWSGTPLLGALNAGSFYPLTLVFVVGAPILVWVLNMAAVYWAGGLGLYLLARRLGLSSRPALLGALVYAYAGAMSGQMVHLGVVQGMGWMPFFVLAILEISWRLFGTGPSRSGPSPTGSSAGVLPVERAGRPGLPWGWVVLLAATTGLLALTGEPRAMAEAELVGGIAFVWLVVRPYAGTTVALRRRLLFGALCALGVVWGVALALAQLLPGWSFIQASQRSVEDYGFFGAGSLPLRWTSLLLSPDLMGGNGLLHQPRFFGTYNLPEVTGYVGLLALGAGLVLLTRSFGRRRDPASTHWGLWLVLAVVGLVAAWGTYLPTGHLFHVIPLFGKTRLQSRNLAVFDLALAVLLAFWAERALHGRPEEAGLSGWRRGVLLGPAALAASLYVMAIAGPAWTEQLVGVDVSNGLARDLTPWFAVQLAIPVGLVALVLGWRRLSATARRRWLSGLLVADVAIFAVATTTSLLPGYATVQPTRAQAAAVLGTEGRFAIYDQANQSIDVTSYVGQPDLNVFTTLPSVQGYGSILNSSYEQVTGAHYIGTLNPCALATEAFTPLRLHTLLVLPSSLAPPVDGYGLPQLPQPSCQGVPPPGTDRQRTFYLGQEEPLTSADLVLAPGSGGAAAGAPLTVGILDPAGHVRWPAASVVRRPGAGWAVRFAAPQSAVGLVVRGPARAVSDASVVTADDGSQLALNGVLQDSLGTSGWRFDSTWEGYAKFVHPVVPPPVYLAGTPAGSSVRQLSTTPWGTETDRVVAAAPVTVVRSEAYQSGWRATVVPTGGGAARPLTVRPHGLVQSVVVPPGSWTLTFTYRAPHLTLGLIGSAVALAGFVAAGVIALTRKRRRRGAQ